MAIDNYPNIGIGVMIMKDGKVLMGKRKNAHGDGMWAFPGGTLEYRESLKSGAEREVMEECGVKIKNLEFKCVVDLPSESPRHFITFFFSAELVDAEPKVMEPEKCEGWEWFTWDTIPSPLYPYSKRGIEGVKTKKSFLDI